MPRKITTTPSADAVETKNVVKKTAAPAKEVKTAKQEPLVVEQETPVAEMETKQQYRVKNTLTPGTFVTVRNGFNGRLVYKSSRTHEKYVWEGFGAEQDIELQELKNAKSAHKAYFERNWFLFDDPEVIRYLGVERFYASALSFDEFDELFTKTPDEIKVRIAAIPDGQKQSLIYKAKQMIADGEIDSIKMVDALEESLGVELIER